MVREWRWALANICHWVSRVTGGVQVWTYKFCASNCCQKTQWRKLFCSLIIFFRNFYLTESENTLLFWRYDWSWGLSWKSGVRMNITITWSEWREVAELLCKNYTQSCLPVLSNDSKTQAPAQNLQTTTRSCYKDSYIIWQVHPRLTDILMTNYSRDVGLSTSERDQSGWDELAISQVVRSKKGLKESIFYQHSWKNNEGKSNWKWTECMNQN